MFKKILKVVLVILIAIPILLPYAIKFGADYYLEKNYAVNVNIDDVSLNLFTLSAEIKGLHIYGDNQQELHLSELGFDLNAKDLIDKRVILETFVFKGFKTDLLQTDKGWEIGGLVIPVGESVEEKTEEKEEQESEKLDWSFGIINIDFADIAANVKTDYLDSVLVINKFKLIDVYSWQPDNSAGLDAELVINDQTIVLKSKLLPFAKVPTFTANLKIDDIQVSPFLKSVKDLPLDGLESNVFSDLDLKFVLDKTQKLIEVKGNFGVNDIIVNKKPHEVKLAKLLWEGEANVVLSEKSAEPDIKVNANVTLDDLLVTQTETKAKLAQFEQFKVSKISVNQLDDINIESAMIKKLLAVDSTSKDKLAPVLTLMELVVEKIVYKKAGVEINNISFKDLIAEVQVDSKGELVLTKFLGQTENTKKTDNTVQESEAVADVAKAEEKATKSGEEEVAKVEDATDKDEAKFGVKINNIKMIGKNQFHFVDRSVTPVFDTTLHKLKVVIKNINILDPNATILLALDVNIDEYSTLKTKGKVAPFGEKIDADVKLNLASLELVPFSSYAGKHAGINVKRGTLDLNADAVIKANIMDVKNEFIFNQLNLESDESEVSKDFLSGLPMPLDLTLDILRDNKNQIRMDVPVKGDVYAPDFSLQDVYNQAMMKVLKVAATHYLLQMVQPLGLMMTAGKLVGKAMAPSFDPLVYKPGVDKVSKENKKHITNIAKLLKEREKLRITVCGNATEADWGALKLIEAKKKAKEKAADESGKDAGKVKEVAETSKPAKPDAGDGKSDANKPAKKANKVKTKKLLALANARTRLVKNVFVEQHKIEAKRIFACNGKIVKDEEDKPAVPNVEVTL